MVARLCSCFGSWIPFIGEKAVTEASATLHSSQSRQERLHMIQKMWQHRLRGEAAAALDVPSNSIFVWCSVLLKRSAQFGKLQRKPGRRVERSGDSALVDH